MKNTDVRKIGKQDCLQWAAGYSTSAINFNKTAQTLRLILDIPIEAGIRYDNPARFIKTMKVRQKPLLLPSRVQFRALVESVRAVNKLDRLNTRKSGNPGSVAGKGGWNNFRARHF